MGRNHLTNLRGVPKPILLQEHGLTGAAFWRGLGNRRWPAVAIFSIPKQFCGILRPGENTSEERSMKNGKIWRGREVMYVNVRRKQRGKKWRLGSSQWRWFWGSLEMSTAPPSSMAFLTGGTKPLAVRASAEGKDTGGWCAWQGALCGAVRCLPHCFGKWGKGMRASRIASVP